MLVTVLALSMGEIPASAEWSAAVSTEKIMSKTNHAISEGTLRDIELRAGAKS